MAPALTDANTTTRGSSVVSHAGTSASRSYVHYEYQDQYRHCKRKVCCEVAAAAAQPAAVLYRPFDETRRLVRGRSASTFNSIDQNFNGNAATTAMLAARGGGALRALRHGALAAAAAPQQQPAWVPSPAQLHRLALAAQRSSSAASTSEAASSGPVAGDDGPGSGAPPRAAAAPQRRQRLDDYVLSMHPEHSRNLVQSWIAQGKVLVNDTPVTKAGAPLPRGAVVRVTAEAPRYVCRAGLKLEAALDHFAVDVTGLTALDAGLSTGGFTDCMLQHGARHVYGVDVGHGQVMGSIAQDPRVTVMERTNLRHLAPSDLPEQARSRSGGWRGMSSGGGAILRSPMVVCRPPHPPCPNFCWSCVSRSANRGSGCRGGIRRPSRCR